MVISYKLYFVKHLSPKLKTDQTLPNKCLRANFYYHVSQQIFLSLPFNVFLRPYCMIYEPSCSPTQDLHKLYFAKHLSPKPKTAQALPDKCLRANFNYRVSQQISLSPPFKVFLRPHCMLLFWCFSCQILNNV